MKIVGCDFHPGWEQVAIFDDATAELEELKLSHGNGEAERFYGALPAPSLIGVEACGNSQWFIDLLQRLGHEVWVGDAAQMRDAAGVNYCRADEIDQLLGDQRLAIVDRVEYLADGNRRDGVLSNDPEALLVFGRRRILHPEQPVRLQRFAKTRRLDRGQPVVYVVQDVMLKAEAGTDRLEQFRGMIQILRGRPDVLRGQCRIGGFVVHPVLRHAVR